VLFVLHLKGVAFVVDEHDLDLAIRAVILVVCGAIGEEVLISDGVVDLAEDVGKRSLEHWVEAEAASHGGEGAHLVFSLEVVHAGDGAHSAAGVGEFADEGTGTDGEDGDIGSGLDLGEDLVEGDLGEGVTAGTDENDVLAAFDAAGAVEGLVEGVKEVGVREAGNHEGADRLADGVLVIGKISEDAGAKVVGDDGDVVIRAERPEEAVGGVLHVANEVVAIGGELKQHDCRNRSLGHANAGDLLGDTVFEDEEVRGLEAGNELVGLVEDDADVNINDGDVDTDGVGFVVGILDFGFDWGGRCRRRLFALLFFLENNGTVVGLRAGGVGGLVGFGLLWRSLSGGSVLSAGRREREKESQCT